MITGRSQRQIHSRNAVHANFLDGFMYNAEVLCLIDGGGCPLYRFSWLDSYNACLDFSELALTCQILSCFLIV